MCVNNLKSLCSWRTPAARHTHNHKQKMQRRSFAQILTLIRPSVFEHSSNWESAEWTQRQEYKVNVSLWLPLCFQMDRCQRRLEQGLPPCPEIEEEWRRMLRDKKRRQRDKEERERVKNTTHTQRPLGRKWLKQRGPRKEDRVTKKKQGHVAGRESIKILRQKKTGSAVYLNMHWQKKTTHTLAETRQQLFTTCTNTGLEGQTETGRLTNRGRSCLHKKGTHRNQLYLKPVQLSAACLLLHWSVFSHPIYFCLKLQAQKVTTALCMHSAKPEITFTVHLMEDYTFLRHY